MYQVYGSNQTALVKQKENPNKLQVWKRDFAVRRQEEQIKHIKEQREHDSITKMQHVIASQDSDEIIALTPRNIGVRDQLKTL